MPTLYIIRGLPGSGKSTLARRLVAPHRHFEADQYFTSPNGEYVFKPDEVPRAHAYCLVRAMLALAQEPADAVVSNTSVTPEDYRPYYAYAHSKGYDVQVIDLHSCTPDLVRWENTHGVPSVVIRRMQQGWVPYTTPFAAYPQTPEEVSRAVDRALLADEVHGILCPSQREAPWPELEAAFGEVFFAYLTRKATAVKSHTPTPEDPS